MGLFLLFLEVIFFPVAFQHEAVAPLLDDPEEAFRRAPVGQGQEVLRRVEVGDYPQLQAVGSQQGLLAIEVAHAV